MNTTQPEVKNATDGFIPNFFGKFVTPEVTLEDKRVFLEQVIFLEEPLAGCSDGIFRCTNIACHQPCVDCPRLIGHVYQLEDGHFVEGCIGSAPCDWNETRWGEMNNFWAELPFGTSERFACELFVLEKFLTAEPNRCKIIQLVPKEEQAESEKDLVNMIEEALNG